MHCFSPRGWAWFDDPSILFQGAEQTRNDMRHQALLDLVKLLPVPVELKVHLNEIPDKLDEDNCLDFLPTN